MTRMIFSRVMWVGRTAATLFGLALVMALVFGVATTAIGATGGNFILGKANGATTVSKLTASVAGPALTLVNQSTEAAATALNISVASGKAPLKVNAAAGTATNLSADELDGKSATDFYAQGSKVDDSFRADFADSAGHSDTAVDADTADRATNAANAANADQLDGRDSTSFANATHAHTGTDITSGAVPEARIDTLVTRDSEVMPIVKSNDGANSGVDADTLDGQNSTAFLNANAKAADADKLDGKDSTQLLSSATYVKDHEVQNTRADIYPNQMTVMCDAGDKVLSGGYYTRASEVVILSSQPGVSHSDPTAQQGWHLQFTVPIDGVWVMGFALCANM